MSEDIDISDINDLITYGLARAEEKELLEDPNYLASLMEDVMNEDEDREIFEEL